MNKSHPEYPYIAYKGQNGRLEIVACSDDSHRLIYDGQFVARFTKMVYAVRYMNREFVCLR